MIIYFIRHLSPEVTKARSKKSPDTGLTGPAQQQIYNLARKFKKASIEWVIGSKFRRSQMCATACTDTLFKDRTPLIYSELADEIRIPKIWGQRYDSQIMQLYLDWRSGIFQYPNETNFKTAFPQDPEAESFLDLCHRQAQLLKWLTSFSGNKIVWGHSQAIEAALYLISKGMPEKIDPVDFVNKYQFFFPKVYGDVATLHYDEATSIWSILAHNQQLPFIPEMT